MTTTEAEKWTVVPVSEVPIKTARPGRKPRELSLALGRLSEGEALRLEIEPKRATIDRIRGGITKPRTYLATHFPDRHYHYRCGSDCIWVWWEPR